MSFVFTILNYLIKNICYTVRYLVPTSTGKWARYIGRIRLQVLGLIKYIITIECLPNRLTPLFFKNYYKEENYLIVGTVYLNI
jgi:hypothetical protein